MTSNRPFYASLLAAFRAAPALPKAVAAPAAGYAHTHSATVAPAPTSPAAGTATAATAAATARAMSVAKATGAAAGPGAATVQAAAKSHAVPYTRSTSPKTGSFAMAGSPHARDRRGSDSSSDGFREVRGADKWYIGGRTATGEGEVLSAGHGAPAPQRGPA